MFKKYLKGFLKQKLRVASVILLLVYFFSSTVYPVLANVSYTYDKNGNMTTDGINCYSYNDENQMVKTTNCTTGKLINQNTYDDQGNRIKQQVYDGNGNLLKTIYTPTKDYELTVLASNGTKSSVSYYSANGEVVARKNPDNSLSYYAQDNLGSTTALTDQSQNVLEKTTYSPYGTITSGGTKAKHLYTGQINDTQINPQSNLDYYNARYYSPHIMHFTQPDTVIADVYNPQELNRYAYVNNNPTTKNDPSGHWDIPGLGTIIDIGLAIYDAINVIKNPINSTNWAALGLDLAAAIIPGIPDAAGQAFKAAAHISDVARTATNVVKDASEVTHATTGARDAVEAANTIERTVPNPFGRAGGIPHQTEIGNIKNYLKDSGASFIDTEFQIKTPEGLKTSRFGDVYAEFPNGTKEIYQVGKMTKNGLPVSREQKALMDMSNADMGKGIDYYFVPYNY